VHCLIRFVSDILKPYHENLFSYTGSFGSVICVSIIYAYPKTNAVVITE
jgi:hypothetical protein